MGKQRLIQMASDITDQITVVDCALNGEESGKLSPDERRCLETEYYALMALLSAYNTHIMDF